MGALAYTFKFQPSELSDLDDIDLEFWRQQASLIAEQLNKGNK